MKNRLTLMLVNEVLKTKDLMFVEVFKHGSLVVEMYQLNKMDLQQPHTGDELYVVISGTGWFVNGDIRQPFEAGKVLFVQAVHRFEHFSEDFTTWVVFYGSADGKLNINLNTIMKTKKRGCYEEN